MDEKVTYIYLCTMCFIALNNPPCTHLRRQCIATAAERTVFSLNGNDFVIIKGTRRYKNMGPQVHRMPL